MSNKRGAAFMRASLPVLFLTLAGLLIAQSSTTNMDGSTPAGMQPGTPAGSYSLSGIDSISLYSGKGGIRIPLLTVGGRGEAGYTMVLPLQHLWALETEDDGNGNSWQQAVSRSTPFTVLWADVPPFSPGILVQRTANGGVAANGCGTTFWTQTVSRLTWIAADGTEIELVDAGTGGDVLSNGCGREAARGTDFVSRDGSSVEFISDSPVSDDYYSRYSYYPDSVQGGYLRWKNGVTYRIDNSNVSWIRDRNGNRTQFNYGSYYDNGSTLASVVDSNGRTISFSYSASEYQISYSGFNGALRTISINLGSLSDANVLDNGQSLQSTAQLFGIYGYSSDIYDPNVATSVTLPDGTSYTFRYNSFGEVTTIALPTGGMIQYSYLPAGEGDQAIGCCGDDVNREVGERKTYTDANTLATDDVYTYGALVTTVDHRAGGASAAQEKHYFYRNASGSEFFGYSNWQEGREYQTDYLTAGGGATLRSISHTWTQRTCQPDEHCLSAEYGSGDSYQRGATPTDPQITQTNTTSSDTGQVSADVFAYDRYNNQTDDYEYDYGSGSPGALLRHTFKNYRTDAQYIDPNVHLLGLFFYGQVYDGSGNLAADWDQESTSNSRRMRRISADTIALTA